jgi:hypothetical protein
MLRKKNSYTVHLNINGTDVVKPVKVTADSAKHSQSVYSTYSNFNTK